MPDICAISAASATSPSAPRRCATSPVWSRTPQEPDEAPALYRFRTSHGLPYHPRSIIYSLSGRLSLDLPVFNTPGMDVIVVATKVGAGPLSARGARDKGVDLIVEPVLEPAGFRRAHERLFAERGVRYLACEGGETILRALHAAGLLDEVFVTLTDVVIDEAAHEVVLKIFDFTRMSAALVADGAIASESPWRFRRWRLNDR